MVQKHQKQKLTYFQEFHPSAAEKLLKYAVLFAQTHTDTNWKYRHQLERY